MSEDLERAHDIMEQAGEHAGHAPEGHVDARRIAVLIAMLAASLALAEMGEKAAQSAYLTHHITASDDWNFYQAKTIRGNMFALQADTLASLPNAADPAISARIAAERAEAKRLDDDEKTLGRKQLVVQAKQSEAERDHDFHRYHLFEIVVGAVQIAIVLASVSVVTRVRALGLAAAVLGAGGALFGLAIAFGLA